MQCCCLSASIWGFETTACYSKPAFIAPTPLLRDPRSVIGRIQPQFIDKHFGFALCVGPGSASSSIEVSRHQINDLSTIQARAMAAPRKEPEYDDEDEGYRSGAGRTSQQASTQQQRRGGGANRQHVVHPLKAYKAVKAKPPKPPAIPKMEWHPVHPIPGSKEANALKFQDATRNQGGGFLSMSDSMGDRRNGGEADSKETATPKVHDSGKRGIQLKRLRGKRKLSSTRSTHHLFY